MWMSSATTPAQVNCTVSAWPMGEAANRPQQGSLVWFQTAFTCSNDAEHVGSIRDVCQHHPHSIEHSWTVARECVLGGWYEPCMGHMHASRGGKLTRKQWNYRKRHFYTKAIGLTYLAQLVHFKTCYGCLYKPWTAAFDLEGLIALSWLGCGYKMDATPRNNQQLRDATWNTIKTWNLIQQEWKPAGGEGGFFLLHQQHLSHFVKELIVWNEPELLIKQRIGETFK